jgi:hypothetical protein
VKLTLTCLLALALIASAACTQTVETPPETSQLAIIQEEETPSTSTPTPEATESEKTQPPATTTEEDIEAARQVVFAYREAYNNYDVEGALSFLEESHRAEREDEIRSDIAQMDTYNIKLGVEEEAEPEVTADGMVAIYIKLDVPVFGQKDRHVVYKLTELAGEWKICISEDVPE